MIKCKISGRGLGTHAVLSIKGKLINYDIHITSEGQYYPRKTSKSHEVTRKEAMTVVQDTGTLIIGNGCLGKMRVNSEVLSSFSINGIKCIIAPTPEAVEYYNNADTPCAAIFHLHC